MTEESRGLAIILGLLVGLAAIGIALGFYNWRARRVARLLAAAREGAGGGAQAQAVGVDTGKGARARRRRPISDRR